jgi:hypothetical protein
MHAEVKEKLPSLGHIGMSVRLQVAISIVGSCMDVTICEILLSLIRSFGGFHVSSDIGAILNSLFVPQSPTIDRRLFVDGLELLRGLYMSGDIWI